MKDILAAIYETLFGLYNQSYDLIFTTLFNEGGYLKFVLSFVLIPLACWLLFYYVWRYPYGKWWHWLIWLIIVTVIVFGTTWGIANSEILASSNQGLNDAIADPESGYEAYAQTLPMKYATINSILTVAITIIYCFVMKQFSKVQTHLPF
jgi:amino acid transporter